MPKQKTCGIYKITSPIGHIYIGASINIEHRIIVHKSKQGIGQSKLFASFSKYGINNHVFEIIHICVSKELDKWEKHYIITFDCFDTPHGLNSSSGGNKNKKISIESIEKSRKGNIGKHIGEKNQMHGKNHTKETKQKISNINKGRKHTLEHRLKNSQALKGRIPWNKGLKLTEEHEEYRKKLSQASKGRKRSPESIAKQKQTIQNRTDEDKERISKILSKALMGHSVSEEAKTKMSNSKKGKKRVK